MEAHVLQRIQGQSAWARCPRRRRTRGACRWWRSLRLRRRRLAASPVLAGSLLTGAWLGCPERPPGYLAPPQARLQARCRRRRRCRRYRRSNRSPGDWVSWAPWVGLCCAPRAIARHCSPWRPPVRVHPRSTDCASSRRISRGWQAFRSEFAFGRRDGGQMLAPRNTKLVLSKKFIRNRNKLDNMNVCMRCCEESSAHCKWSRWHGNQWLASELSHERETRDG